MSKKSKKRNLNTADRVKNFTYKLLISYIIILIVSVLTISTITLSKTNDALIENTKVLINSLNIQTRLNIESYLNNMEDTAILIFSDELNYTYDPTDPTLDTESKVRIENIISKRLYELCIMENFCDYGIVYSDNTSTGKISNSTKNLLEDNMYQTFKNVIDSDKKTSYAWYTGFKDDYNRIYYVKQINKNAIFVSSFYNTQLKYVFEYLNYMDGMCIQLLDEHNKIVYSSDTLEIGNTISNDIISKIGDNNYTSIVDKDYILSSSTCGDKWVLISYIPTKMVLKQNNKTIIYIIIITSIVVIISIIGTIVIVTNFSKPIESLLVGLTDKSERDLLTKLLNKQTFQDYVTQICDNISPTTRYAFIILDLDNFKGVNDTLGHIFGDKVLANVGDILRRNFKNDLCGRLGGDEFAVFMKIPSTYNYDCNKYITEKCIDVCAEFKNNYTGKNNDYKISASIGISVFPSDAMSFADLYSLADKALYKSKHKGKDTFTIYNQYMNDMEV